MTIFDDRKDIFEKSFSIDETRDFQIEARLAKLYGLWAAEQLGLENENAEIYAREVITANLKEPGFEDILECVHKDFEAKALDISRARMEAMLRKCLAQARTEITEGA